MYRHWLRIKHTLNTTAKVAVCLRFTLNPIFSYNIMLIHVDCTSMLLNWNPSEIGDLFIYVRSLTKDRIDVTLIYCYILSYNVSIAHIFYLLYIFLFSLKLFKEFSHLLHSLLIAVKFKIVAAPFQNTHFLQVHTTLYFFVKRFR